MSERICILDGCVTPVLARDWCTTHYGRWTRHGDPLGVAPDMAITTCTVDECERPHLAKGYCSFHYGRWQKYGDANTLPPPPGPKVCTMDDCAKPVSGRGWCSTHYMRWRKYGDPLAIRRPKAGPCRIDDCEEIGDGGHGWCEKHYRRYWRHGDPLATSRVVGDDEARFWFYVDKDGPIPDRRPDLGRCWLWTGAKSVDGYGILRMKRRTAYMPRWSYELHVEPIAEEHEPDHLCRVTACVNPGHLEPVTHRENVLRGESPFAINARKTHCVHGHPFDEANTAFTAAGYRRCRACTRLDGRRRSRAASR